MLFVGVVQGNIANNRNTRKSFDIRMSFDAVAEQAQYIDDGNRNAETEYQGCQVNYLFIGRYGYIIRQCVIYDFSVVGGGGKRDIVFFAFLQQHQVKPCLDFLLALDADKAAFLCRSIADLTGIFACLAVEVGFSDEQSLVYAVDGSQKAGMHIVDVAVEPADYGVGVGRSAAQTVALQN